MVLLVQLVLLGLPVLQVQKVRKVFQGLLRHKEVLVLLDCMLLLLQLTELAI